MAGRTPSRRTTGSGRDEAGLTSAPAWQRIDRIVRRSASRDLTSHAGVPHASVQVTATAGPSPPSPATAASAPSTPAADAACVLPADYVTTSTELGYASTVHTAQGVSVDTMHGLATGTEGRQQLYTMLTRERHANHVYLQVVGDGDPHEVARRAVGGIKPRVVTGEHLVPGRVVAGGVDPDPVEHARRAAGRPCRGRGRSRAVRGARRRPRVRRGGC